MPKKEEYSLGLWNILSDFQSIRASSDFVDFVILDLEHGYRDFREIVSCALEAKNQDLELIVRLRSYNDPLIQALLDIGIDHFVVPQIRNLDEIKILRTKLDFPPEGQRGTHPKHSYGKATNQPNKTHSQVKLCVIFETVQIVEDFLEVVSYPGVDEIYLGTYDLSSEMQITSGPDSIDLLTIFSSVVEEAKLQKKPVFAMVGNKELLAGWIQLGVKNFVLGVDTDLLRRGLVSAGSALKSTYGI